MVKPYSDDLRERVVGFVLAGGTVRQAAAVFGVAVSSAVKWSQRQRVTGSFSPKPMGGRRRDAMAAGRTYALARLSDYPSLALRALQAELAACGVKVSYGALWSFVHAEGLSFKKTVLASETERPEIAARRARWRRHQGRIDPRRLVFIDGKPANATGSREQANGIKTNMAPLRGWGPRGKRLAGRAPHGHWRTLTFIAALRADRIDAPCVFNGPINGEAFTAWVERVLAPTLAPGDVVILDNLGSHKGQAARAAIRKAGAHMIFLPPYSPDLNPIEQVFAKAKHLLREAAKRTQETLFEAISKILDSFTPSECANYLTNSGYGHVKGTWLAAG